jgi:Aldo/keto reductase family
LATVLSVNERGSAGDSGAGPNTATLSFRAARYHSPELTLLTTELTDNAGHPLQAQTPLDARLVASFDVPPYVNSADQSGAVPFLDIGNQYILAGAQYDPGSGDDLSPMVQARDEGLIAGVGLSNVSLEQLRHAADAIEIVCVQNLFHLADRGSTPVLAECLRRGIAFVPFCPLGLPRGAANPVLTSPAVIQAAARLGVTPAQVALQWLLQLAPNVLLIPGTGSTAHLLENLAAEHVALDDEALRELTDAGA